MPHVLLIDRTGAESQQRVGVLVRELRLALRTAHQGPTPVRLVVTRQGHQIQGQRRDHLSVLSDGGTSVAPWLGLVIGVDATLSAGAPLSAHLTGYSPDPFDRVGLCTWKATATRDLVPESHLFDIAPVMIDEPRMLASLLYGLDALLNGSYGDALDHLEAVTGQVEPIGCAQFSLTYWLALAHLGVGLCLGSNAHFDAATGHLRSALSRRGRDTPTVVGAAMYRSLAQAHYQRLAADPDRECSAALENIEQGLRLIESASYPVDWARLIYERASVALYRPRGKDVAALAGARQDLSDALTIFEPERFPLEHSHCQNALGRLDVEWYGQSRRDYQRSAASHYKAALRIRHKSRYPWHFAQTQHNLGNLFLQRLEGDQADNADRAVHCFTEALSVFDVDRFPQRHLQSLAALGRAYLRRNADAGEDLRRAILCFEEVATSVTAESFPYLYARTLFDLGNARCNGAGSGLDDPAFAIERYRQALPIFSASCFPVDRAHVLVALAGALIIAADTGQDNTVAEALACYAEALDIFDRVDRPADAACVHACLAVVLLASRPQSGGNLHALALSHQQAAQALVSNGTVRDVGGDGIEAFVVALLRESVEVASDAAADRTDRAGARCTNA